MHLCIDVGGLVSQALYDDKLYIESFGALSALCLLCMPLPDTLKPIPPAPASKSRLRSGRPCTRRGRTTTVCIAQLEYACK